MRPAAHSRRFRPGKAGQRSFFCFLQFLLIRAARCPAGFRSLFDPVLYSEILPEVNEKTSSTIARVCSMLLLSSRRITGKPACRKRLYRAGELIRFRHSLKLASACSGSGSSSISRYRNCFSLSGRSKKRRTDIFQSHAGQEHI